MHGYPNRTDVPTSKDANACYAATQLIVWQISLGFRTSPTALNDKTKPMSGHSGTMMEQLTANPYLKSYYDRILSDMAKHNTRPSFTENSALTAPVYELTQSGGQYRLTLTDTNNVLSDKATGDRAQGDSTLNGAVFEVFNAKNQLVDEELAAMIPRRVVYHLGDTVYIGTHA